MKTSTYFNSKVKKQLEKFFDQTTLNRLAKKCGFTLRKAKKIAPFSFIAGFLLQCSKRRRRRRQTFTLVANLKSYLDN